MKRLRWYAAADVFYLRRKNQHFISPTVSIRNTDQPISELENRVIIQENLQEGGGIRLINGFRYQVISNLSISTEIALTAQRVNFSNTAVVADGSRWGYFQTKHTLGEGWRYNVEIKPFFRLFINYHF